MLIRICMQTLFQQRSGLPALDPFHLYELFPFLKTPYFRQLTNRMTSPRSTAHRPPPTTIRKHNSEWSFSFPSPSSVPSPPFPGWQGEMSCMSRRCGRRHTSLGEAPLRFLSISWGEGCRCHVCARYITYVSVGDTHTHNLDRSRAALAGFFFLSRCISYVIILLLLFCFCPRRFGHRPPVWSRRDERLYTL